MDRIKTTNWIVFSHIQASFFIFEVLENKHILKHNAKNEDKHNAVIIKPLILKIHPNTKNKIEMIPIIILPPQFQTLSIQVHPILYLYQNTNFVGHLK